MEIVSSLQNKYDINNPIFIDEIRLMVNNYSKIRIAQLIQESIDSGKLARFENGIYYIPTKTILGNSTLSTIKVIEKKYIKNDKEVYGFYCGITFMNNIGLSTQVPNTYEIMTNKESTRVRKVKVENQEVVLRKSRVKINKDNYITLQFLEFITSTSIEFLINNKEKIRKYFFNNVDKNQVIKYMTEYPSKTIKNLYSLELLWDYIKIKNCFLK